MAGSSPTWEELAQQPEEKLPWEEEEEPKPEHQSAGGADAPTAEELAQAARAAARAQAEAELEAKLLAEEEAREEWVAAENRRLNHAATCAFAARDFAEVGDFKSAVGSARQALGLDPANIEARAVLNYCRSSRRAARPAGTTTRRKQRASGSFALSSRSSLSTTSLGPDGPAFAVLDGDGARRSVIGQRPVSASSSLASLNSSVNPKPRTLFVLGDPSLTARQRSSGAKKKKKKKGAKPADGKPDESSASADGVSAQFSYELLRESGSTSWVTVGPAPGDLAWSGDQELLERVENLEAAMADMLPEPEPEPEIPEYDTQTALSGGVLDVWHYVYAQAAHLYSFVPGDRIEVLSRRRVTDKESGEARVEESWHPAVVTSYNQPYLSEEERAAAEAEARQQAAAQKRLEENAEDVPEIFKVDDGTKAAEAEARQARRAASRAEKLTAELAQLSVGGLRANAASYGIKNTRVEAAWKAAEPAKELIELIVGFAEEAYESDDEADKSEAEAVAELLSVGLLDSWSLHFVYADGHEPPRWRAGQPLHGAEVELLLAPPPTAVTGAGAGAQNDDDDNETLLMPQQGVDMVRRNGAQTVDWSTAAEQERLLLEAAAAKEAAEAEAAEAEALEKEAKAAEAEAAAAQEEAEAAAALAVADREQAEADAADAHADTQEAEAAAAAAALAEELEEAAAAQARAEKEAAEVKAAEEQLQVAIDGGDPEAIVAAELVLEKEKREARERRLQADEEAREARCTNKPPSLVDQRKFSFCVCLKPVMTW
jgi:hypothetical protein